MDYDDAVEAGRMAWLHQPRLLTSFEHSVSVAFVLRRKFPDNSEQERRLRQRAGTLDDKLIDEIVDQQDEREFLRKIGQRLLRDQADKLILNRCPQCNRITRTPKAHQCLWCHHDWH